MHEDGLDRERMNRERLDARMRGDGGRVAEFAAGEEGPMSQGIADWRGKQGEMRIGACDSSSATMLVSERDASGPRKGLQAPLIDT